MGANLRLQSEIVKEKLKNGELKEYYLNMKLNDIR